LAAVKNPPAPPPPATDPPPPPPPATTKYSTAVGGPMYCELIADQLPVTLKLLKVNIFI
jgi:hypothetical protein